MSSEDLLKSYINRATEPYTTYPSTFREIREGFREKYDGHWTREMAKATGVTPRQIQRFEAYVTGSGKQARNPDNVQKATKTAFIEAGKTLDPLRRDVPPGGLTITVKGSQGSGKHERTREFTATMDYQTALQFVQDPTLEDLFDEIYPDWDDAVEVLFGDDSGALSGVSIS